MMLWIVVGGVALLALVALAAIDRLNSRVVDLQERLEATQAKVGELKSDVEDRHGESSNA